MWRGRYATFCHLAGVSPIDERAAATQPPLPPIDSLNVWPLISGANRSSPRTEWPITPLGEQAGPRARHGGDSGYMLLPYKLLVGRVRQAGWPGKLHPNVSLKWDSFADIENCTVPAAGKLGCLFDVMVDPSERHDLALEMPEKAAQLWAKLQEAELRWFDPDRGSPNPRACQLARDSGYWQPFLK